MFRKVDKYFADQEPLDSAVVVDKDGIPTERDLHVATAVLLIEIAGRDRDIDVREARAICQLLSNQFKVEERELPELVNIAMAARKEPGKIDHFIELVNKRFSVAQRTRVLAMIWSVIQADGKVDDFEKRFAHQLQMRFRLNETQVNHAKKLATGGRV